MGWQDLLNNLQNNNQTADDATTQLVDRARMGTNPNIQGPPLPPDQSMPQELKYSQAMGNGVMGIAAPANPTAALSNLASGPAMVQAGSPMWKQMMETQIKNRLADATNRAKLQALTKLAK